MDTTTRPSPDPVGSVAPAPVPPQQGIYARLLREGYRFDFYQAVRLLERLFPDAPAPGTSSEARREPIRFRPDHAMVFPAADLKTVAWQDGAQSHVDVVTTFLGLYGIDSPLPQAFYEPITLELNEAEALRDFLDIFNQRFYAYFYRAWKKYRPNLHDAEEGQQTEHRRFLAVAGLGTPGATAAAPVPAMALGAFAARLMQPARNAEGLRSLAESFLDGVSVEVEEFVPRWVTLPQRVRLGTRPGCRLGHDTTIGRRVYDVSSGFRLHVGPVPLDTYLALLPGGEKATRLRGLVQLYTANTLDFDVELILQAFELPRLRLGNGQARLGLTTYLGRSQRKPLRRLVQYEHEDGNRYASSSA